MPKNTKTTAEHADALLEVTRPASPAAKSMSRKKSAPAAGSPADAPAAPAASAALATLPVPAASAAVAQPAPGLLAAQRLDQSAHALLSRAAMGLSPISLTLAWADWSMHLAASPGRQSTLGQLALELAAASLQQQPGTPPRRETDDRFRDPAWEQWPFNAFKSQYKAACAWWEQAVQVDGVARHHAQLVNFFTRQWLDSVSPSNWAATNPLVRQAARDSGGQSLLQGLQLLGQDVAQQAAQGAQGEEAAAALQPLPYRVGIDVGVTPGKVVYRNRLIELIRYEPTTATVHPEPVLVVPSCIMKYYILDLSPQNSMVRYLVGQGHTVYIVSWRNPDEPDRDLGMRDYLHSGVMDAMAAVGRLSGARRIHAAGYCLGGTFLAIVAAALAGLKAGDAQPHRRHSDTAADLPELASVTLLTTLTDFSEPGQLGVFIDDDQLRTLREEMARTGFLSGKQMAGSFQFLGSRDLIWARNVRRYLLGKQDQPNDLMSWNADVTRLPERMHSEYLQSLYLNNALAAGRYRVGDAAVALSDIHAPMFVVGTSRDHVAPWKSVYKIHLLTDTDTTFVLASGGHNAGVVSEPGHARRSYQLTRRTRGQGYVTPEDYAAGAPVHEGSWWEAWSAWLVDHSSARVPAPPIPADAALCDAPGEYVHVRYAD
ncbi:poly-beta-hydroxybutyrate polymerase-like protein [Azohydromonas sp. G-1-1-14]|uniref:Poly-beta-hydroxybutyrate polymerase-like protein n=2 Tax=Azohydromonas caseinilytica TaxID=2728836 RepID=A0A848FGA4_9BURK|nr:poly-beta-hydroxybutyrate polymerase-like protein [Azohydromonas caseinilytica]